MDQHQAERYEQANTELVDAQNSNVCIRCGNKFTYGEVLDANDVSGEVEIGHDEDCPILNI